MKNRKSHGWMLVFSIVTAVLTMEYYQLTVNGIFSWAGRTILVILLFAAALFAMAELLRRFCEKVMVPLTDGERFGKAYLIMAACCLLVSALLMGAYLLLRKGGEPFAPKHPGIAAAGGVLLFILFVGEILLANAAGGSGQKYRWFRFGREEWTVAVLCLLFAFFSFIPLISDAVEGVYPVFMTEETVPKDYGHIRLWLCIYNALIVHVPILVLFRKTNRSHTAAA